jgi:DNA-binding FrmR family transcriptional regulator
LLEEHIRIHVVDAGRASARQRTAAEELIQIVQSYFK